MPFRLSDSRPNKYSFIEHQKIHEYEYKKFLKTLSMHNDAGPSSEQKLAKQRQINLNNSYLTQRQIKLQYRQDQRKHEYERIQRENLRFSQRLINAKACLNRCEQEAFFDKHCKLKQRLQHYPDTVRNQAKKSEFLFSSKNRFQMIGKPTDPSFLIYNDNPIPHKLVKLREKGPLCDTNKTQISQKKLPRFVRHNPQISKIFSPIIPRTQHTHLSAKTFEVPTIQAKSSPNESSLTPSPKIIHWNQLTSTEDLQQSLKPHRSSQSSSELSI